MGWAPKWGSETLSCSNQGTILRKEDMGMLTGLSGIFLKIRLYMEHLAHGTELDV
jgi:hypothetical protein